jgi:hypothetical protein
MLRATLFIVLFLTSISVATAATITEYKGIFRPGLDREGGLRVAIREFKKDGEPALLLVNPNDLSTCVAKRGELDASRPVPEDKLSTTPYIKSLRRFTKPSGLLQNHGARRSEQPVNGLFMTIDMCPSVRPFEQAFFESLMALPQGREGAVPVAVAMTGAWLKNHPKELSWLKEQQQKGRLTITWVNHSLNHPYNPKERLERTFLLTPGTDFDNEVLATEKLLLENGLLPAPFFRFPGLVSDDSLVKRLGELGLIPLGSDAWLAKGETPKMGSFILVHGNGNEPQGIRRFPPLLQQMKDFHLLPLTSAFVPAGR